jgi:hypothetical protein
MGVHDYTRHTESEENAELVLNEVSLEEKRYQRNLLFLHNVARRL